MNSLRKRAVRLLQNKWKTESFGRFLDVIAIQDNSVRCGYTMFFQKFRQVHFVGAGQYGLRIIYHNETFGFSTSCNSIGVMVNAGCFTDKKRVEFVDPGYIIFCDQLHVEIKRLSCFAKFTQRSFVRWGQRFLRIYKYRHIVPGLFFRPVDAPFVKKLGCHFRYEWPVLIRNIIQCDWLKASQNPDRVFFNKLGSQKWRLELHEKLL